MFQALIMHGTMSTPQNNWTPWLKDELGQLNVQTFTPQFPTPQNQTVTNWLNIMDQTLDHYGSDTLLIGHSSAPLVICAKLQQLSQPVKAVFFIAPFLGVLGLPDYDLANRDFIHYPFDWDQVKRGAEKLFIYRSDHDPYVPEASGAALAHHLHQPEIIIPGGGHLNSEAGYTQFSQLLNDIKTIIS